MSAVARLRLLEGILGERDFVPRVFLTAFAFPSLVALLRDSLQVLEQHDLHLDDDQPSDDLVKMHRDLVLAQAEIRELNAQAQALQCASTTPSRPSW